MDHALEPPCPRITDQETATEKAVSKDVYHVVHGGGCLRIPYPLSPESLRDALEREVRLSAEARTALHALFGAGEAPVQGERREAGLLISRLTSPDAPPRDPVEAARACDAGRSRSLENRGFGK